jgi:hypothetical protein
VRALADGTIFRDKLQDEGKRVHEGFFRIENESPGRLAATGVSGMILN